MPCKYWDMPVSLFCVTDLVIFLFQWIFWGECFDRFYNQQVILIETQDRVSFSHRHIELRFSWSWNPIEIESNLQFKTKKSYEVVCLWLHISYFKEILWNIVTIDAEHIKLYEIYFQVNVCGYVNPFQRQSRRQLVPHPDICSPSLSQFPLKIFSYSLRIIFIISYSQLMLF